MYVRIYVVHCPRSTYSVTGTVMQLHTQVSCFCDLIGGIIPSASLAWGVVALAIIHHYGNFWQVPYIGLELQRQGGDTPP